MSLILLLILSLILTITEGARVSTAKVYAERALSSSMDSVLAEYYEPLWEEYHMFGLYTGCDSVDGQREQIANKMTDYMSYTFEPNKEIGAFEDGSYEPYHILLNSMLVQNETLLMDYQGKLLINEAVEYMKYREIGNGIELLLDKLSLLETPKKVSYVYQEKQAIEEELVEIDKGILELMELLDGLQTSKKGIEVSKDGSLQTAEYFVKKICFGEVTKEEVGINQDNIYEALKGCYVDPMIDFETIDTNFTGLEQVLAEIEGINADKDAANAEITLKQAQLDALKAIENKTEDDKLQIETLKSSIKDLKEEVEDYDELVEEQEKVKAEWITEINKAVNNLSQLVLGIKPIIDKAITVMSNIILKMDKAKPLIDNYETLLYSNQELIGADAFAGLEENLKEIKKYIAIDESGYDFAGMKATLMYDQAVILQVESYINQGKNEISQKQYKEAKISFANAGEEILLYQTKGLTLDYSTFVIDASAQENPLSAVNDLLQSGMESLVIDPQKVSDKKLTDKTLPSQIAAMSEGDTDFVAMLTDFFENSVIGDGSSGMGNLFGNFGDITQVMSLAGDGVNKLSEHLLYQEYLKDHFEMYEVDKDSSTLKPSALAYEQEYLLVGKRTDQKNLSAVIARILFLRTILDFVSILGDSAKRNEARLAATALVGFTGLPILIAITQGLILLVWSFAEALLDVCALMMGKEVPILKKGIVLEFPELFMLSRSFLQSKATAVTGAKEISLSYQDYLRMFLLMKDKKGLAYRSMDLMQENIKLRYNAETFDITDCLFGYEVTADYTIPSKFTAISFVQKFLHTNKKGFGFATEAAYSY